MILKKPYAFLIKYFRIIHLLLLIPIGYLIKKTFAIVSFFRSFVANGYSTNIVNISGTYINLFMYGSVLIILISVLAIYYLMRQKKKQTKLYFYTILYYIFIFILIGISHSILSGMEKDIITAQTARAYRDISSVIVLPQYFFFIYILIRGIGFDIKKFDFANDLKDLEITDVDREEFEFSLNVDGYKVERKLRRFVREFVYYFKENTFVFSCIIAVFVIFVGTILYLNFGVYNKTYYRTDKMIHNYFNIQIQNSYLTNRGYDGRIIKDGKYYLVLQLKIVNKTSKTYDLDYNNFRLILKGENVYPLLDRGEYFVDLGKPYYSKEKIKKESSNTYVLAYELTEKQVKKRYEIKILEEISYGVGAINARYKTLKLTPTKLDKIENVGNYETNKIINLKESNLGYTTVKVEGYELTNNYVYDYEYCNGDACRNQKDIIGIDLSSSVDNKTLLILKMNYNLDKTTNYGSNVKADNLFFDNYLALEYFVNGESMIAYLKNRTTEHMKDTLAFEVNGAVKNSDKLNLLITVRNKRYKITLK